MNYLLTLILSLSLINIHTHHQSARWEGKWEFKDNDARYFTLTVQPKNGLSYPCKLEIEGPGYIQTLACTAMEKAGTMQLFYKSTESGKADEKLKPGQLLLNLRPSGQKVLTSWNYWHSTANAEQFKRL